MKQILIILGLFASVSTFAQSPRIKLNQITKDSVVGSVLISSPTDSGMVYSRDLFISYGVSDTVLILGGDTLAKTSGIISSVLSDGITITGDGTTGSELTADTSVLATLRALSDSLALVISSVTADNVTITGDGTVGSPLEVDTTTYIATKADLDAKQDQLNGTGFVKATGTTISYDNSTYLTSEVDGSVTNEIQDISTTGAAGNISISSGSTLNLNVDDADASASNELQTLSYNSSTNEITLSDGGGTEDLSNLDLVDSTRINATGDTAYYYQNGVLIGTGPIAGGGGGTTYNNISETVDTVYISDYLDVDTATLYVDATNNRVGIGTSSPSYKLNIYENADVDVVATVENASSAGAARASLLTKNDVASFLVQTHSSGHTGTSFGLNRANMARFVVLNASSFLFGTFDTTPIHYGTNAAIRMTIKGNGDLKLDPSTSGASSGNAISWNSSDSTIYFSTSSIRFKENINDYDKGISTLMQLNPVYFNYKTSPQLEAGFIAEDVENIGLDEYITKDGDGLVFGLRVGAFKPLIVKAIQEQQDIIENQATQIDQLKTLITDLTNRLIILENN